MDFLWYFRILFNLLCMLCWLKSALFQARFENFATFGQRWHGRKTVTDYEVNVTLSNNAKTIFFEAFNRIKATFCFGWLHRYNVVPVVVNQFLSHVPYFVQTLTITFDFHRSSSVDSYYVSPEILRMLDFSPSRTNSCQSELLWRSLWRTFHGFVSFCWQIFGTKILYILHEALNSQVLYVSCGEVSHSFCRQLLKFNSITISLEFPKAFSAHGKSNMSFPLPNKWRSIHYNMFP